LKSPSKVSILSLIPGHDISCRLSRLAAGGQGISFAGQESRFSFASGKSEIFLPLWGKNMKPRISREIGYA
jgi:hypothetical protein